jgi:type II secretory pathway component PulF
MNVLETFNKWSALRQLRMNRADFYFDIAAALDDRVPLFTIMRKYESRSRSRSLGETLVYMDMIRALGGGSLSSALRDLAPNNELIMIDALQNLGDASMAEGLRFLSTTVEKTDAMLATARKSVMYPIMLLVVFSAMLTGFSFHIVPILSDLLPPNKWPFLGKVLYWISQLVVNQGVFIACFFIGLSLLFFYSLPRWRGPVRKRLDRYLPFSFYRDFSGAMLIVALASLMRTGVSLRSSLERTMEFCSPWMRMHLREILRNLARSHTVHFGEAFKTGVLNQYLEDRVQDASERRNPVDSFVKIGVGSIDRVIGSIEKSAKRVSSSILIFCGILLFIMMGGFFSTTMELQSGIRNATHQSR